MLHNFFITIDLEPEKLTKLEKGRKTGQSGQPEHSYLRSDDLQVDGTPPIEKN